MIGAEGGEHEPGWASRQMQPVRYGGWPVAMATAERFWLVDSIVALPEHDALRVWAGWLCVYASDVLKGELPGPYEQHLAEAFARAVLMPSDEFTARAGQQDSRLAAHFNVPVEQVAARRLDAPPIPPHASDPEGARRLPELGRGRKGPARR